MDDVGALVLTIGIAAGLWFISPWLVVGAAGVIGYKWWNKWRYENLQPSEKQWLVDWRDIPAIEGSKYMYLGTTQEGTIRWWYYEDYLYPQAVDNNEIYWDKRIHVQDEVLRKHLDGFYEMGNEWPEYYRTVVAKKEKKDKKVISKKKRKNKSGKTTVVCRDGYAEEIPVTAAMVKHPTSFAPETIKAVESDMPRADYAIGDTKHTEAKTAAWAADVPLMELVETVKELEKDATGACPTINFEGIL